MSNVKAELFDLGHTLVDLDFSDDILLEVYEQMHQCLSSRLAAELPAAPELSQAITRRIGDEIVRSYAQQRLEELNVSDLFDEFFRAAEGPAAR